MTMTEKFKILAKYIKDMSSETPDVETYISSGNNMSKYQLDIDIKSIALKNKMIEVNITLKFQHKDTQLKKSHFEIVYAVAVKIDESISDFRFNVSIAYFYQVYKIFKEALNNPISNKVLSDSIIKIMKLMTPFTPHLSYECLELFKCKTFDKWPIIDKKNVLNEVKLAVQINGKTRDIILINRDMIEEEVNKILIKNSKAKKYIEGKNIVKTIFVKNKIINYIVKD